MLQDKLQKFMQTRKCTLLGAGPMSLNCVNAVIDLANDHSIPLMLIASRRQIDSGEFGGGYVENWTTRDFANYVLERDKKGKVLMARDHGGPWQNPLEKENNLGLHKAMESAKRSYAEDIACGFQVIHIDPSVDIHATPSQSEILDRIFELYEFCWSEAQRCRREIIFEIGTEEQSGTTESMEAIEAALRDIQGFCERYRLPKPTFIVMQTGTKVLETRNVGVLDYPFRIKRQIPAEIQIPRMLLLCQRYNIWIKQHNTDYLSDATLAWHPRLGIHAANVAPEFGVAETRAFLALLRANKLDALADVFLDLAWQSGKWKKWLAPDSVASKEDQAVMAGHYVFATEAFHTIKNKAQHDLAKMSIDLDAELMRAIKIAIGRYLLNFRMVDAI